VVHPESLMPIADGTTRRRPTASQLRKVKAKNRTCVAPGWFLPPKGKYGVAGMGDFPTRVAGQDPPPRLAAGLPPTSLRSWGEKWTYQPLDNGDYLWTSPLGGPGYTTSGNDPP
jgi:hypothetical protein